MHKRSSFHETVLFLKWITRFCFVFYFLVLPTSYVTAQSLNVDELRLIDKGAGRVITLQEPAGLSSNYLWILPSTNGTAGQTLSAASVSGTTINLGWFSTTRSYASLSDRLTADVTNTGTNAPSSEDKFTVNVVANKPYRIQGVIRTGRVSAAGGSDGVVFNMESPSGTDLIWLSITCYDCPSGTFPTLAPYGLFVQNTSAPVTSLSSSAIDPGGAGGGSWGPYTYQLNGIINIPSGGSAGNFVLWPQGSGGTNDHKILAGSFIVLTELK